MQPADNELDEGASLVAILGYLNHSAGKPEPRFQKALAQAYAFVQGAGSDAPWRALRDALTGKLTALQQGRTPGFGEVGQAERVLALAYDHVLPAYRAHHADLLFHQGEADLWQPFFLARVFESILAHEPVGAEPATVVARVLSHLNDYIGHRPIAVLESRPTGEPYAHERVRPIPLYLRGAGTAPGRYHDLLAIALDILRGTDQAILREGCLDPDLLDELALDPRAYDHIHPASKRPNYIFGEWDPHQLDNQGRYRRFVVRQVALEALQAWPGPPEAPGHSERQFEAAVVLAGILLMAAAVSGAGPDTYDSSVALVTLVPRIARNRDRFYDGLLMTVAGHHGEELRAEAGRTRQPFQGARQHLNDYLARHRARQGQERRLALLFATLGWSEGARRHAAQVPAASARFATEIHLHLVAARGEARAGDLTAATARLPALADWLHRGIACGALADPWNVLGFGGLYPLFQARDDSVRDSRIDELVASVEAAFDLHAHLLREAVSAGDTSSAGRVREALARLATWWDRFGTAEVAAVPRVVGAEVAASADHVAEALGRWRQRGQKPADLAFWRQHLHGFRSPAAFALVVEALLDNADHRAALGLLMSWLGQREHVPLQDEAYSFHELAVRWIVAVCLQGVQALQPADRAQAWELIGRFLDHLEANAEEYWDPPRLEAPIAVEPSGPGGDRGQELYAAAYDDVTFRDSTDASEGELVENGPQRDFILETLAPRLHDRLQFLATVARLWGVATRLGRETVPAPSLVSTLEAWLDRARANADGLLRLLDALHEYPVPAALTAGPASLLEFSNRRALKDRLVHVAIETCLEMEMAAGALRSSLRGRDGARGPTPPSAAQQPPWEGLLLGIEDALWQGNPSEARRIVPEFLERFRQEPLLYVPLAAGGPPRAIMRARVALALLRALVSNLPRLGLVRETLLALGAALDMEEAQPAAVGRVTEFPVLFELGLCAAVDALLDSALSEGANEPARLVALLEQMLKPFLDLWARHGSTFRVATLETVSSDESWSALRDFISRYGGDLFDRRFVTPANLRGILQSGVGAYLESLQEQEDAQRPVRLAQELDHTITRADAERHLDLILACLLENVEEYRDYSATAPQADYGQQLHLLLDFLRLKADYDRSAWQCKPLAWVHGMLVRRQEAAAAAWQAQFAELVRPAAEAHLRRLAALQQSHGIRLRTVADHVGERLVGPLDLDRLCVLVRQAIDAPAGTELERALARVEAALQPYLENPSGVGLDAPNWLQRLEQEVGQALAAQTAVAALAEKLFLVPKRVAPLGDLGLGA